ncbi:MAG TPA: DinB family protein [Candidatus Eisenbacteria bacterium]|nr:DinB family protein [Candidatus Eisenbacteria bacterium]
MTHTPEVRTLRPGPLGAVMDETERAAAELERVFARVTDAHYEVIVDPDTQDEDCRSIQTIVRHVIQAGYGYANRTRRVLGIAVTREAGEVGLFPRAQFPRELRAMLDYTIETLEGRWEMPWEEQVNHPVETPWGGRFTIELLLEHGIVHLLRHRRQLEKFLAKLGA